jgi:Leucine-rich repeat (LRR) protein
MKTKKILLTAIATIVFIAGANAQNVTIPDANFKAALVNNSSINTNMDAEIQVSEASVFNGAINVSGLGISDLTGIEAFVLLDSLDCSLNQIASLNVSANTALTYLNCSGDIDYIFPTLIDSLDVSANSLLTTLICCGSGLLSLNTTGLTALTYLDCSYNERGYWESNSLPGLPQNNEYFFIHISYPILNFTGNTALNTLICSGNGLLSLNTTGLTALTYLDCSYNEGGYWQSGFETGADYNWVHISYPLLNFNGNTALTYLNCSSNGMTSLNVSTCSVLTTLNCSNNLLPSLTLSGFNALTNLNCYANQLTSLDVSVCTALTTLNCSGNDLTNLNVSGCTALTSLNCSGNQYANQLTSLDVSACTALTTLDCSGNQLTILNASGCTALTSLNCSGNQITSLNVKNGNNINMVTFIAIGNPSLSCIEVDNVQWSIDNWTAAAPQTSFFSENCSGVGITDNNETKAPMFYPNPTTGSIYLPEPANITLSDLSGKLLLEEKNKKQLDISALPAGMYFLSFGENNKHTFKVIKE